MVAECVRDAQQLTAMMIPRLAELSCAAVDDVQTRMS